MPFPTTAGQMAAIFRDQNSTTPILFVMESSPSENLDVEFLSLTPPEKPGEPYTIAVRIIDREDEADDADPADQ